MKYCDIPSTVQVLGNIFKKPALLEMTDKYKFNEQDFPSEFHRIVFGSIYNLYQLGAKEITLPAIEDYLSTRPKKLAIYKANNGAEYLLECAENCNIETFPYYYNRIKKMSLLRAYSDIGMDVSFILDEDNILDSKKKQEQEDKLDNMSLHQISDLINEKIDNVKLNCVDEIDDAGLQLGDDIDEILDDLATTPAVGYPLYGKYINTIIRGARLGKFFLRSAATGVGKTRSMIADACFIGCSQMYDLSNNTWVSLGAPQATLFIATEQDLTEVTTMALAFIAGVNEEHILLNEYYEGERDRVAKASQILKNGKIFFSCMPDFTVSSIENTIKKNIRDNNVKYIFFDYIHSSASILMEVGGGSKIKGLREDNVLFLLSSALKDIAVKYGVFVLSSTQLNGDFQTSETPNQNLLRGSKAIADRIDAGLILMEATKEDKEKLRTLVTKTNLPMPDIKMSIYKNRQGKYKDMYLWVSSDRGCCRFNPVFATNWNHEYIELKDLRIKVEEESIF